MERDSMVVYRGMLEAASVLPDEQRLEVYEAVLRYGMDGKEPSELSREAGIIFALVRPLIDNNNKRFADGKRGGRPAKKPVVKPVVKPVGKPNENENENENENGNENASEENAHTHAHGSEFASVEQFYEEMKGELLGDSTTLTDMQRLTGKPRGELLKYLDSFQRQQRIAQWTHANRSDFRKHFVSWLCMQVREGQSAEITEKPKYQSETEKIKNNADNIDPNRAGYSDF